MHAVFLRRLALGLFIVFACRFAAWGANAAARSETPQASGAISADAVRRAFDVPASEADAALKRFAEQSGVEVLYSTEAVAGVRTAAVKGTWTPAEALERLLAETPLRATRQSDTGAWIVSRQGALPGSKKNPAHGGEKAASGAAERGSADRPIGAVGYGSITGRVFNPVTGEYVRNAEVGVRGTALLAITEGSGVFLLSGVPAGEATLVANYTGYEAAIATVTVAAGETASQDLELSAPLGASRAKPGEIIELAAFVVSSDREGNAKAIMDQRQSMNITNTVASDTFGDVNEGNVGEFLKFLPGVDLEYNNGEPRVPRLRGLDPQYTGVAMDGVSVASADALIQYNGTDNNPAGAGNRSFGFEQVSLNSIESVEVSFTSGADMDANAPAGTINLRTKRAFDRKGRRVAWQVNASATSEAFTTRRTWGPDDDRHHKILPGGMFEISDVYLGGRLGVVLNLSESNKYAGQGRLTINYDSAPTAANPHPVVPTTLAFRQFPRRTERFSASLTADFKATKNLVLSLNLLYNFFNQSCYTHVAQFNASRAVTAASTSPDPLIEFTTNASGSVGLTSSTSFEKLGKTVTLSPKFEYKRGPLLVEGRFSYSASENDYEALSRGVSNNASTTLPGVSFHAKRSSHALPDWTVTQLSGPDWSELANFPAPNVVDDGRSATVDIFSGQLDAKWTAPWREVPTFFKTGLKAKEDSRSYRNHTPFLTYRYVGPVAGNWTTASPSPREFTMGSGYGTFPSRVAGLAPTFPSVNYMAEVFRTQPENFVNTATVTNFYDAFVANTKDYREEIDAAYALAQSRLGRLQLQAGLRWERTSTASKEFEPRTREEILAAGYAVSSSTGRATTIPGLQYQYFSLPRVVRRGSYDNFFPSASAKYTLARNLHLHAGYSHTVSRPAFNDVSGLWVVDEINLIVNAPNPNLKPEQSDNLSARLAYYFEPVGSIAVGVFQNDIKNLSVRDEFTAAEFGYGEDPDFADYTFVSRSSAGESRRFRGMTVEYNQQLSFLPGALRGLGVFANYTRNYASLRRPGMAPHMINTGLSYAYRRLSLRASLGWTPETPYTTTGSTFRDDRTKVDAGGSFRLTDRTSLFFQVRNLFNTPEVVLRSYGSLPPTITRYTREGSDWAFGVKGTF